MTESREEMIAALASARAETFRIYDWLIEREDERRRSHPSFRPMLWHLGHIGAFEEWWLLIRLQKSAPLNARYQVIFDPIKTPRESSDDLPPRAEIEEYLSRVRGQVERIYLGSRSPGSDPLLERDYIFHLVLEHEYQHQETLSYLLQMMPPERKRKPSPDRIHVLPAAAHEVERGAMARVPGGRFVLGATSAPFVYDNELPPHEVELGDFRLDSHLVTNGEYAEFIAAGGYGQPALWSEEGWRWKEEQRIERPLYWSSGERIEEQQMFALEALDADLPVTGVSWYEASAYARFVGKRLPTEAEWERAAAWDGERGRKRIFPWGDEAPDPSRVNFGGHYLGPTPIGALAEGASASGCLDMGGNLWEWTSTTFAGYPGFEPYPYAEYSELWFDGDHRVLKGGSWMTRAPLLRASFRNFFRPGFRQAFAGFRCASD